MHFVMTKQRLKVHSLMHGYCKDDRPSIVRGVASHFFPLSPFKKMVSLDNSVKMSYS